MKAAKSATNSATAVAAATLSQLSPQGSGRFHSFHKRNKAESAINGSKDGSRRDLESVTESGSQTRGWQVIGMQGRVKEDESISPSGSDADGTSMGDEDGDRPHKKGKRYHRHTPYQIQEMEQMFKECPHPDEKQRMDLSHTLGLEPRQVKFWFQNRRTQMKAHTERAENSVLRSENDRLRSENNAIREALKNATCPKCGASVVPGPHAADVSPDLARLLEENSQMRVQIERISSLAALQMGVMGSPESSTPASLRRKFEPVSEAGPSGIDSRVLDVLRPHPGGLNDQEREYVYDMAFSGLEELVQMARAEEPLWSRTLDGTQEELNLDEYQRRFVNRLGQLPFEHSVEASRASGLVASSGHSLVDTLTDPVRWMEMFPTIVFRAATAEILSQGSTAGNRSGSLQLVYAEFHVLSPLVPSRETFFLRYCKQLVEGSWAVVDVSVEGLRANPPDAMLRCRRRASGYIVQDVPGSPGCCKVTILEHLEVNNSNVHKLFKPHVASKTAFGAARWLSLMQRQCLRNSNLYGGPGFDPGASTVSPGGRRSMIALAQRMTTHFCTGVSASTQHRWTTLPGSDSADVRVMTRKNVDSPGEPRGLILSAATTVWLATSVQRLFDFLKDEKFRAEWDILANGGVVSEMGKILKDQDPSNSVSLLKVESPTAGQGNMLILQENSTDFTGKMIVYAPVDIPAMQQIITGGDPENVALLPSGFVIQPDMATPSERRSQMGLPPHPNLSFADTFEQTGTLLTVAFQILVSPVPQANLSVDSITTVNSLITCTVQRIRSSLNC